MYLNRLLLLFVAVFVLLRAPCSMVYAQIRINEVLIDPSQKIELFNFGTNPFDISGWFLDDSGGSSYFIIPQDTTLVPNSCRVFEHNRFLLRANQNSIPEAVRQS